MADVSVLSKEDECIVLPPGFRFHPSDEEIITHYLSPKVINRGFSASAMGEVDLNSCEPWDLPSKAKMGEKEWYFFCQRDRKYPTSMRTNRATQAGFWKATGKDKEIFKGRSDRVLVGMKKTLVFYRGRAPKGEKTSWVMHEYRLEGTSVPPNLPKSAKDEWAVCRVFHKDTELKKSPLLPSLERINSFEDDLLDSTALPPLMDPPYFFNSTSRPSSSFSKRDGSFNFINAPASFSSMLGMENQAQVMNHQVVSDHSPKNSSFYSSQVLLPPPQSSSYQLSYLHQDDGAAMLRALAAAKTDAPSVPAAMRRQYSKVEQHSNQSMMGCPSQETGLSTDHNNTEISSSVVSKQQHDDMDDPSSSTAPAVVFDLENMWKY